jgi:thiamine-monophosphate kinase
MQEGSWIQRYIVPLVTADGADRLRDDVALLSAGGASIITMDTLVEGVHFLASDPRATVGQKLVRVNVSDILAKGAEPQQALVSIAWPKSAAESDFEALMTGLGRDLTEFGIALIGGDLVSTDGPLTLTMTLTGQCFSSGPVRRTGGRAGQDLLVHGEIGWGGLGLQAARGQGDANVVRRYQVPEIGDRSVAQVVAAQASASMDVSDGLLLDVSRLAAVSGCGAAIELANVPLAAPSRALEKILAQCVSGDDYRILIAVPFGTEIPGFSRIGCLTESPGLVLTYEKQVVNPPSTLGFEHEGQL